MEGNEPDTVGAKARGQRANGFPHDPQCLGSRCDSARAGERSGTMRTSLIEATAEVLADASDPSLGETRVARGELLESALGGASKSAENCILVAFADSLERLSHRVTEASAREERWLERLHAGLEALLGFLDDETQSASVLVLQAPMVGSAALSCSRRLHGVLVKLLNEGRGREIAGEGLMPSPALMAELIAGGVFSLIRVRML